MKKVMIVDPSSTPQKLVRSLGYLGYEVISPDFKVVYEAVNSEKPDLIVVPFNIQEKLGLDIVRRIRKADNTSIASIPIIVVSSADKMEIVVNQVNQVKECKVNEFIIDPVNNFGLLIDRITLHISGKVESSWNTLPPLPKAILTETLGAINTMFSLVEKSTVSVSDVTQMKRNKNFSDKDFIPLNDGRAISIGKLWNSFPTKKLDNITKNMNLQIIEKENQIDVLLQSLKEHDNYNFTHCIRVALYLGLLLKHENTDFKDIENHMSQMIMAALLHDIGHTTVDKSLIHKTEKITREELEILKSHAMATEKILLSQKTFSKLVVQTASTAHERLDASGYPRRFDGSKLYPSARMIAVVDAYDAMISKTSYREPLTSEKAFAEIRADSGKFDQNIVNDFESLLKKVGG